MWTLCLALPIVFAHPELSASAEVPPKNVVIADLGQHVIGLGYQRSVKTWLSLQVAANFYDPWTQNTNFLGLSGDSNRGDLLGAVVRSRAFFYPFASAPTGFWLSPFTQYGVARATRAGERRIGAVGAVGVGVGYSVLLGRWLLLGGGTGLQYHAAHIAGGEGPPSFRRLYPHLDIQAGYAF